MNRTRQRTPSSTRRCALALLAALTVAPAWAAAADDAVAESIRAQGDAALTRMTGELRDGARWQNAGQRSLDELLQLSDDRDEQPARFADHAERG